MAGIQEWQLFLSKGRLKVKSGNLCWTTREMNYAADLLANETLRSDFAIIFYVYKR